MFRDARLRRAVNYALERKVMAAQLGPFLGRPSDAYLPLGMPGSRNDDRYPLARPDLATARAFLGIAPPLASSAAFTSLRVEAIDDEGSAP